MVLIHTGFFLAAVGYMASVIAIWFRVGSLRNEGISSGLPSQAHFLTGTIFFWLWSNNYRAAGDVRLKSDVSLARGLFTLMLLLFCASILVR